MAAKKTKPGLPGFFIARSNDLTFDLDPELLELAI